MLVADPDYVLALYPYPYHTARGSMRTTLTAHVIKKEPNRRAGKVMCLLARLADRLAARPRHKLRRPRQAAVLLALTGIDPRSAERDAADTDTCARCVARSARTRNGADSVRACRDRSELRLLFTRRTDSVSTHKGQVAFPGGRAEPGELPSETALREVCLLPPGARLLTFPAKLDAHSPRPQAHEEIGLPPERVRIVGLLDDLASFNNDTTVTPVVGHVDGGLPPLVAERGEVARIFSVRLSELRDPARWETRGQTWRGGLVFNQFYFSHEGETIWGLSAYATLQLISMAYGASPVDHMRLSVPDCPSVRGLRLRPPWETPPAT